MSRIDLVARRTKRPRRPVRRHGSRLATSVPVAPALFAPEEHDLDDSRGGGRIRIAADARGSPWTGPSIDRHRPGARGAQPQVESSAHLNGTATFSRKDSAHEKSGQGRLPIRGSNDGEGLLIVKQ